MSDATPLARSAARQAQRDIDELARGGARVTLADVSAPRAATAAPPPRLRDGAAGAVAQAMARQSGVAVTAQAPPRSSAPAAAQRGVDDDPVAPRLGEEHGFPPSRRTPLTNMRRVIADRLAASKRDAPHYYMSVECIADALLDMRRDMNATLPGDEQLSVNDLILGLTARCLARHPALNAAWAGDAIVTFQHVNLAVAVAVDGGLVTPVLRMADRLSLRAVHAQMQSLLEAARRRALPREAFQGGTFTLSNLGMYPVSQFAAIVNPPQAAILAVAAAQRRVVALDDERSAIRRVMTLTLSVDHRVADGVAGAALLADLRALIEEPRRALL